ncbi:ABC-2 type transporter [Clostridium collagenovorans DSM 3089]|uniref:ABC-2 type transporter n=1 Tax=Clostridium collagenovorans DSM 3089 TaxID=1121306 RepID=A0A1M5X5U4_9CLOT|nr:ABC transporter permease [Clostridium collagenovorans]SHH95210.1 ABC-2 type transporter [Clostridium collagenovorans DSM 3089]
MINKFRLLSAEVLKIIGDAKAYWFNLIFGNLNIFFLFLGIFYGFHDSSFSSKDLFTMLLSLMIWYYGVHAIDLIALIIEEEKEEGTLEQIFMTQTNFTIVLMNRIIAQIIFDTIKGILVFSLCVITFKIPIDFIVAVNWWWTLLIFFTTLIGLYGIGYMVAGFALLYKRVSSVAGAFSNILLFFTGIIIEVERLPIIFQYLSKLLPLHWGMNVLQVLVNNNFNMSIVIKDYNFPILIANVTIWIIIGLSIFTAMKKKALNQGTINQY